MFSLDKLGLYRGILKKEGKGREASTKKAFT